MAIPTKLAAAGVTAADYEMPGLLSWTRPAVPDVPVNFRGGSTFGNYVRKYPDLMADFLSAKDKHGKTNIAEYGRMHWDRWGKDAGSRTLGEASPYLSLADQMDYPFDASGTTATAGLPMPDVPGYKYVYPKYSWESAGGGEAGMWKEAGTESDIDKYPYYPYFPGSTGDEIRDDDDKVMPHMLVGVRLIKE
tara:strand:- start:382 stop:957 length:576 start_codon:yes stop_codon:yes gene_type:complete